MKKPNIWCDQPQTSRHKREITLATLFKRKSKVLSDEEIVRVIVEEKDHDQFGLLYDRYADKVYRKCISFAKDSALAQDMAHDVFLKAFVNLAKFNHRSRFSTWLYSLTYNFCVDFVRKAGKVRYENEDELYTIADDEDERNEQKLLSLRAERLGKILDELDPDDKAILLMRYQDDLPVKELEEVLELSASAVKMRTKRARARALEMYHKTYGDE